MHHIADVSKAWGVAATSPELCKPGQHAQHGRILCQHSADARSPSGAHWASHIRSIQGHAWMQAINVALTLMPFLLVIST